MFGLFGGNDPATTDRYPKREEEVPRILPLVLAITQKLPIMQHTRGTPECEVLVRRSAQDEGRMRNGPWGHRALSFPYARDDRRILWKSAGIIFFRIKSPVAPNTTRIVGILCMGDESVVRTIRV